MCIMTFRTLTSNIFFIILAISCTIKEQSSEDKSNHSWTFTYLKAKSGQKESLKLYLEKNWFAMDSIAVKNGLFNRYELYENLSSDSSAWDFIVAVEYFSKNGYKDVQTEFEAIREEHEVVKVNNRDFKDLGTFVKSEAVIKNEYSLN